MESLANRAKSQPKICFSWHTTGEIKILTSQGRILAKHRRAVKLHKMSPRQIRNEYAQCERTIKLSSDRAKANTKAIFFIFAVYSLIFFACRLIVFAFGLDFP